MGQRLIAVAVVVASACTALHYSWTAQSSVVVSNNPYTFNGPGSQVFVISPAGSGDDDILQTIYLMNCNSQWMLDTSIDPQQPVMGARVCAVGSTPSGSSQAAFAPCPTNYQFQVFYSGAQPGVSSCNVVIESMPAFGSGKETITLVLTGVGSGSSGIVVSPAEVNFQDVQINTTSSPLAVTVKNVGSSGVEFVSGSLSGQGFTVQPALPNNLALGPGSSATYQVRCMPTSLGMHTGTLTFTGNSNSGSASLECNGIDSSVNIAPTQVVFDDTLVGRPPPAETVTITGGAVGETIETVALDSAAIAAGVSIVTNPQGQTVGSGQDVVLAYSAAAMHAAGPLGTLSIKVSSDAAPRNVGISGQALLGGLGTNPASVDFGAVCANATATKDIEVYASESGDIVLQQLTPPAVPFGAEVLDELPMTLSGNHSGPSASVRVSLTPTAGGDFKDAIALHSNVPNMDTTEVQLHGVGLAGGIAATPDVVHFGAAEMGTTTSIKEVQLTNCGSGDLMFERAQITGTDATDFTLIGANPPRPLAPTESEVFMVVMQPKSPGYKTAQLVITHGAGTTTANLDGTGLGERSSKDRETYYACSTGRGTAALPIVLALALLVRRRRNRA